MNIPDFIFDQGLILIPALNIIGMIVKSAEKIPDKYIPIILLAFGIAGVFGLAGISPSSAVQGVLITGAAVYGNQIAKQLILKTPAKAANSVA